MERHTMSRLLPTVGEFQKGRFEVSLNKQEQRISTSFADGSMTTVEETLEKGPTCSCRGESAEIGTDVLKQTY